MLVIFLLFILKLISIHSKDSVQSVEKQLIRELTDRYQDNAIFGRPVINNKDTVVIEHKLQLIQILDLDESRQILVTNCWSNLRWVDSLMKWNPLAYGNITTVRVMPEQIWTPDILLYNFADERMDDKRECRVKVYNTGDILWVPQSLFMSTCSVEITFFPFDSQVCKMEFGSWSYDQTKLDIIWWREENQTAENFIDHNDYMTSNEWQSDGEPGFLAVEGNQQSKAFKVYRTINSPNNEDALHYPVLRYILRLKRNPSYYISILIVPCILLSSLTLIIFWLPPESPAKLTLGISIFVAFFVLLLLLGDVSPKEVKNFPLIGAYFCLNMVLITFSTFISTLTINVHFKGGKSHPLPYWMRRIAVDGFGSLFLIRQNIHIPPHRVLQETYLKRMGSTYHQKPNADKSVWMSETERKFRKKVINQTQKTEITIDSTTNFINTKDQISNKNNNSNNRYFPNSCNTPSQLMSLKNEACLNVLLQGHLDFERDIREIKRYIRIINHRQKVVASRNLIAMEYRTFAVVLDRLFFILHISTIITTVIVAYNNTEIIHHELTRNISNMK